jgi:Protein of unknown function (DUF5818)
VIRKRIARITIVILAGSLPLVGETLPQRTQPDRPQTPHIQTPPQVNNDEDLRFFTGKISSNSGKYFLEGASARGAYLLDDQKSPKSAKEYEGKHVRVIGVLEAASNTIHVRNIEEAAGAASVSL